MNYLLIIVIIGFILIGYYGTRKKTTAIVADGPIPTLWKDILLDIPFYEALHDDKKLLFNKRLQHFLSKVTITGIRTTVDDKDRVLVAASAIIPILNFKDWEYRNLNEVLLYPDAFGDDFKQTGEDRNVLGMVGSGAMNNVMILSQHELRQAFMNKTGKTNTAIHEFVHLVDKTDGDVDGVPELFLDKQYIVPWLKRMHEEIRRIRDNESDINPYGATNESEFLAVVAEYFFERPDLLEQKHPELYQLLTKIFKQDPAENF